MENLGNYPLATLSAKELSNVLVMRAHFVFSLRGVEKDSLFHFFTAWTILKLNLIGLASLVINLFSVLPERRYYFILNIWGTGYHHWLTEVVLKLVLFEEELKKGTILIPQNAPHFIKETLRILSFHNVEFFTGNVFAKHLTIITNPTSGHYHPQHLAAIRDKFLQVVPATNEEFSKIYVSRKNARARKIVNEDEVTCFLQGQGFKCIELENVLLTEQVNMFRNCQTLVSIHGAALTNALFMPPGSRVLEFYPKGFTERDYFNACYHRLNEVLAHKHAYLFCEREFPTRRFSLETNNIVVDIDALEQSLKALAAS